MDFGLLQGIWTIIVMVTFLVIVAWAWSGRRSKEFDEAANIPFKDEENQTNEKD